jgi:PA14 domain
MRPRVAAFLLAVALGAAPACAPDESSVGGVLGAGPGLAAAYFAGRDFQRPSGIYEDANIDFEGSQLNDLIRARGHVAHTVSILWTGQISLEDPGTYTLFFELRGRGRLWVDDALVIDSWVDGEDLREPRGTVTGGGWRNLRIEWDQIDGPMTARLSAASPSRDKAILPPTDLRHDAP